MSDEVEQPPAPPAPPAPPVPTAASSPVPVAPGGWGPKGEPRSWVVVFLLTLITCGIYGLFWQYRVFEDNKRYSGEGVGGAVGLVIALLIGIVNWFLLPAEIGKIQERRGQEQRLSGLTGFWNLIPLVGFLIWLAKVQGAMNEFWES